MGKLHNQDKQPDRPIFDPPASDTGSSVRKQYHPPACASVELELRQYREGLNFESEYLLNSLPNSIDLLITKKDPGLVLDGFGAIFRKYNLIEYRSPRSVLNEAIFYRTIGYAYLLAAYNRDVGSPDELTVTFIRQNKPIKLIRQLALRGFVVSEQESGIYYVRHSQERLSPVSYSPSLAIQFVVTRFLDKSYHWINKLSDQLKPDDWKSMVAEMGQLKDTKDLLNAESVFDLVLNLNKNKKWLKELIGMGTLRDLLKDDFEERDRKIAELSKELQSKDEQLQSKDEQLQSKDEQLQNEKNENTKLRQELESLRKQINKIAMF